MGAGQWKAKEKPAQTKNWEEAGQEDEMKSTLVALLLGAKKRIIDLARSQSH